MNTLHQHYKEIQDTINQKITWNESESYSECVGHYVFENIPIKQKFIEHPHFIICYGEWTIDSNITVPIQTLKNTFKLQFEIEGYSRYQATDSYIEIPEDCFNLLFVPQPDGQLHYKKNRRVLEVVFDEDYFMQEIVHRLPFYLTFAKEVQQGKQLTFYKKAKPITSEIHKLLLDLLHNTVHISLKSQYLQQKVDEILLLVFNATLPTETLQINTLPLNLEVEDKILHVKTWIDTHFLQDISLKSISQQFYINEAKLKHSFKKYYSISVVKYIKELRFNYAYLLLESGKYSISEVAHLIHYEYPQHFSIAFKNRYGKSPSTIGKKK